jgi:predicted negative regulator of RcsB-dependent stress response
VSTHLTRKELKQDNVALKVGETFDFFTHHRPQFIRYGGAAVAAIVIAAGVYYYVAGQREARQQMLGDAIAAQSAPVGAAPPNGGLSFPTEDAKKQAVIADYTKLVAEHGGSEEAYIAEFTLGGMDLDNGKMADARKKYQDVADHANANYASLARLALAQLDFAENKTADAQTILKDLQDHPTDLVSKTQATFALAKVLAPTQPEEARKLLTTIASAQNDASQVAVAALQELPAK